MLWTQNMRLTVYVLIEFSNFKFTAKIEDKLDIITQVVLYLYLTCYSDAVHKLGEVQRIGG